MLTLLLVIIKPCVGGGFNVCSPSELGEILLVPGCLLCLAQFLKQAQKSGSKI